MSTLTHASKSFFRPLLSCIFIFHQAYNYVLDTKRYHAIELGEVGTSVHWYRIKQISQIMILKFSLYSAAGVALLSSAATDAFVPSKGTTRVLLEVRSSLDRDWDNSDFLSSLSGGSDEIAEVNAKYQAQSQSRAKINEWRALQMQKELESSSTPLNASNESGDYGPTPELLRKMMGDENIRQQAHTETQQAPQMHQQQAAVPPPPQQPQMQQQQFYDANGNPIDMTMVYDANGNLVQFYPPPPPQQQPMQQQQPEQ